MRDSSVGLDAGLFAPVLPTAAPVDRRSATGHPELRTLIRMYAAVPADRI